ncbi:MAG: hypothetical protein ABL907_23680 [Hyphomicrobium sp.]
MNEDRYAALERRIANLERRLAVVERPAPRSQALETETSHQRRTRHQRELEEEEHELRRRFARGECDILGRPRG